MLLLPFGRSELNAIVLKQDFFAVVSVIPFTFLVTTLGYLAVLSGSWLWKFHLGIGLRKAATQLLDIIPQSSRMLLTSRSVLLFQASLCIVLQFLILAVYFAKSGFGFALRDFTFANPELRPIALLISNYSVIIGSHCLARYMDTREKILLGFTFWLSFGLLFFGARANILAIFMNVFICYLIKRRAKLRVFRFSIQVAIILIVGLYMGNVRAGEYSLSLFFSTLAFLLFYGNNFSDLRDFSWVYAKWDHVLWMGKTYLAGFTAFVPRFASQFRDTWGIGVATDLTAGIDPRNHPGLRPGYFGEGFFNFGLLGVICVGLLIGIVLRRVDIDTKKALSSSFFPYSKAFASTNLLSVVAAIAISANITSLYILILIYMFSWLCLGVQRMIMGNRESRGQSVTELR
jgi:oligosaccharide repeat unit polymerase